MWERESEDPIQVSFEQLNINIKKLMADNRRLIDENQCLKTNQYKDKELAVLKNENQHLSDIIERSFIISEEERIRLNKWTGTHPHTYLTYKFTPTNFGIRKEVQCCLCDARYQFSKERE